MKGAPAASNLSRPMAAHPEDYPHGPMFVKVEGRTSRTPVIDLALKMQRERFPASS